jgi:hypothetical protein
MVEIVVRSREYLAAEDLARLPQGSSDAPRRASTAARPDPQRARAPIRSAWRWPSSRGGRVVRELAEKVTEGAGAPRRGDRRMDAVEVDNQPEQLEIERSDHQVEDRTDGGRGLAGGRCGIEVGGESQDVLAVPMDAGRQRPSRGRARWRFALGSVCRQRSEHSAARLPVMSSRT